MRKGREGKGREGKGREGKGREGKGREGKGREWKGRVGKGTCAVGLHIWGEGGVGRGACNPCCLSLRALADTVSQMS